LGERRGPAISFSTAGEEVWAALCGDESDIGIDVAGSAEFQEGYPVHRVFHVQELHQALELAGGDLARAAALLWSIKEAVAKALGCAFHLVDPRDIHVYPSAVEDGGPAFSVRLSGKALVRFPMADRRPIAVRSLAQAETWLSIAALNWPRVCGRDFHLPRASHFPEVACGSDIMLPCVFNRLEECRGYAGELMSVAF
jgi:phosphopantetheinyl transferase